MGENHTAIARGADAVSLNPAGLAMPDGPMASASFLALRAVGGLGPIGLGDLARFDGREVPDEVRLRWLERITAADVLDRVAVAIERYPTARDGG